MLELKRIRKAQGITQEELGKKVGYGRSMISAIELGDRVPSSKHVVKIAKVLGISVEQLMAEETEVRENES